MNADSGIIRTRRDRNNPYAMVNKAPFENSDLSWEARGVLAYLLTKPDDWQVRTSDLLKQAPKCGGDKLARILKELEMAGYLVRERRNIAGGRFEWVTTIYENPLDAQQVAEKTGKRRGRNTAPPLPENPVMDAPQQEAKSTITGFTINGSTIYGKPAHIVNTELNNKISTRERVGSARERASPPAQTNLDQLHEGVAIYKRLTGKRTVAPATVTAIAEHVTDYARFETAAAAWIKAGYNPGSITGMLDWYDHPEKMKVNNGPLQRDTRNGQHPDPRTEWAGFTPSDPDKPL